MGNVLFAGQETQILCCLCFGRHKYWFKRCIILFLL